MNVAKIFSLLVLVASMSCKKCIDCSSTFFEKSEDKLLLKSVEALKYSNGEDTIAAQMVKDYEEEGESEECGAPKQLSCRSHASVTVFIDDGSAIEKLYYVKIDKTQNQNNFEVERAVVAGPFELVFEADTLGPKSGKNYTFNRLNNYTFNNQQYQHVQEISSGSARLLYHSDLGFIEMSYDPAITYTLIP